MLIRSLADFAAFTCTHPSGWKAHHELKERKDSFARRLLLPLHPPTNGSGAGATACSAIIIGRGLCDWPAGLLDDAVETFSLGLLVI